VKRTVACVVRFAMAGLSAGQRKGRIARCAYPDRNALQAASPSAVSVGVHFSDRMERHAAADARERLALFPTKQNFQTLSNYV
jgi:hypothetical protein